MRRTALRILAMIGCLASAMGFGITVLSYSNDARRPVSFSFYPASDFRHVMAFYTPYLLATALFIPAAYLLFSFAIFKPTISGSSRFRTVIDGVAKSLTSASSLAIVFCMLAIAARVARYDRLMRSYSLSVEIGWDPLSIWNLIARSDFFFVIVFAVFCSGFCWRYARSRQSNFR
jgi:hypothetical protein